MGRVRGSMLACFAAAAAASGCANFRELEVSAAPQLIDLITNVECDLTSGVNAAVDADFLQVKDWGAIISFTLETNVTNKGEVALAVGPPVGTGTLSIGFGGSKSSKTTSKRAVKYALNFGFVPPEECSAIETKIAGSVGAGTWLNDVLAAFSATQRDEGADPVDFVPPQSVSMETKFLIQHTGNAGPAFTLVPIGTSTIGGSLSASGDWSRSHEVSITISPLASPPAAPPAAQTRQGRKVAPADLRVLEAERIQFLLQELPDE